MPNKNDVIKIKIDLRGKVVPAKLNIREHTKQNSSFPINLIRSEKTGNNMKSIKSISPRREYFPIKDLIEVLIIKL